MPGLSPFQRVLASPAFVVSVAVLALNDAFWKKAYHNALTGKLSDFAGVFAVTLVLAAVTRSPRATALVVVAAFAWWKSPLATPVIAWWNATVPYSLGRTIDTSDLAALVAVPFALWYLPRATPLTRARPLRISALVVAVLAVSATSRRDVVQVEIREGSRASALIFDFVRADGGTGVPTGSFNVRRCGTVEMVWDIVAYAETKNRPEPPILPAIRYGERPAGMWEWTKPAALGAGCYEARLESRDAELTPRGIQFEVLADGSVR